MILQDFLPASCSKRQNPLAKDWIFKCIFKHFEVCPYRVPVGCTEFLHSCNLFALTALGQQVHLDSKLLSRAKSATSADVQLEYLFKYCTFPEIHGWVLKKLNFIAVNFIHSECLYTTSNTFSLEIKWPTAVSTRIRSSGSQGTCKPIWDQQCLLMLTTSYKQELSIPC